MVKKLDAIKIYEIAESGNTADGSAVRRKVDNVIMVGREDEIVMCIKALCFGTLTTSRGHFAIFLEKNESKEQC